MSTSIIGTRKVQGGFKIHRKCWIQGWSHWFFCFCLAHAAGLSFGFLDTFHPGRKVSSLAFWLPKHFENWHGWTCLLNLGEMWQFLRIGMMWSCPFLNGTCQFIRLIPHIPLPLDIENLLLHGITIFGTVISRQVWGYGLLYFAVSAILMSLTLCQNTGHFFRMKIIGFSLWLEILMDLWHKIFEVWIGTGWGTCIACSDPLGKILEMPQSSSRTLANLEAACPSMAEASLNRRALHEVPLQRQICV